jgi:K+-transporting ATPase A subunit
VARSILRALAAGTVITIVVTALWAFSTTLTSAGPVPAMHLRHGPVADYGQLAGTVTGSVRAMFAVDALIYATCLAIAGRPRRPR